jgi:hypothetical protein
VSSADSCASGAGHLPTTPDDPALTRPSPGGATVGGIGTRCPRARRRATTAGTDVELGDEFYLSNPAEEKAFPSAPDHGTTVAAYGKAVLAAFPGALVAAVGSLPTSTARERTWNHDMLDAAEADGGRPDALTLHEYLRADQALTASGVPALLAEPATGVKEVRAAVAALPVRLPVWITEYSLRPGHTPNANPARLTYSHARFTAGMDLLAPRVTDTCLVECWSSFHTLATAAYAGSGSAPVLSPAGVVLRWVDEAAAGAGAAAAVEIPSAPLGSGGPPSVVGKAFSRTGPSPEAAHAAGSAQRSVIVNPGSSAVRSVPVRRCRPAPATGR